MNCDKALELLSGHMDNANTPEEEAQLQAHLASCPACQAILTAYEEMDRGLASLQAEPPAALISGVMDAIGQEAAPQKKIRRFPTRGIAATAVAAALLLVIGTTYLPQLSQQETPAASAPDAISYEADTPTSDTAVISKAMPADEDVAMADAAPDTALEDDATSENNATSFQMPQSDAPSNDALSADSPAVTSDSVGTTADALVPNTMTVTTTTVPSDAEPDVATDPTVADEVFPDGVGIPELLVELTDDPAMPAATILASLEGLTASPTASDRIVYYASDVQTVRQILVEVQAAQKDGAAYNILRPIQLDTAADTDVCGLLVIQP